MIRSNVEMAERTEEAGRERRGLGAFDAARWMRTVEEGERDGRETRERRTGWSWAVLEGERSANEQGKAARDEEETHLVGSSTRKRRPSLADEQ